MALELERRPTGKTPAAMEMEENMFSKWKEKLRQFMIGRYGVDDFSKFLLGAAIALIVLSIFIHNIIFELLILLLLVYTYYRMFSKNISARYRENQKYQLTVTHKAASYPSFLPMSPVQTEDPGSPFRRKASGNHLSQV